MRRGFGFHDRHSPFRFDPATLFIGGAVQGAWYDPSDPTTLFQDSNGASPVTASGQSVGLMLDKSQNLAVGSELITNGSFSNGLTGWTNSSSGTGTATVAGGVLTLTRGADSSNVGAVDQSFTTVAGRLYKITATLGGAGTPRMFVGTTQGGTNILSVVGATGAVTRYFFASGTTTWLRFNLAGNNSSVTVDDVSITSIAGNHAYQTSAGSCPVYTTSSGLSYLAFDGSNDLLLTNSINFTATDKVTVWSGVTKLSDVARGMVVELGTFPSNGCFQVNAPHAAGLATFSFTSQGTLFSGHATGNYAAPTTNVLTGIGNIGADIATLRVNGTLASTSSADQGTGNYGNYPLYIGARSGPALPFNGRLYGLIVLGAAASDWQVYVTEQWMAGKTGLQF